MVVASKAVTYHVSAQACYRCICYDLPGEDRWCCPLTAVLTFETDDFRVLEAVKQVVQDLGVRGMKI